MKKVYLEHLFLYPKKETYQLAYIFGRRLVDYLGRDGFCMFLDSKVLLFSDRTSAISAVRDQSYLIHTSSKGLEFFLRKLIDGKSLKRSITEEIPNTFDNTNPNLGKIKNRKLILKTKSTWGFCRNEIMHPSKNNFTYSEALDRFDDIINLVVELYKDFYGKTEPDQEIVDGFNKYFTNRNKITRKSFLSKIFNFIR